MHIHLKWVQGQVLKAVLMTDWLIDYIIKLVLLVHKVSKTTLRSLGLVYGKTITHTMQPCQCPKWKKNTTPLFYNEIVNLSETNHA